MIDWTPPSVSSVATPQRGRLAATLLLPQSRHHELEVGSFDRSRAALLLGVGHSAPALADEHAIGLHIPKDVLDQPVLDRDLLAVVAAPLIDRAFDHVPRVLEVERLDPDQVREQVGQQVVEAVELGERVLADRDEEVRLHVAPGDRRRKLVVEGDFSVHRLVVGEVLLELVEDDQHRPADAVAPRIEDIRQRAFGRFPRELRRDRLHRLHNCCLDPQMGSPVHERNTATMCSGAPYSARLARSVSMSRCSAPAERIELLPMPLAP